MEKINVLISENSKNIRKGLRALLQLSPMINHIWEAEDGENAILMIESLNPDLVITAAEMPMIGGVSIARWIKQYRSDIKVILLTMYPNYEDDALAAGVNRFLVKGEEDCSLQEEIMALFQNSSAVN